MISDSDDEMNTPRQHDSKMLDLQTEEESTCGGNPNTGTVVADLYEDAMS